MALDLPGRLAELDTATWDGHARWVRTAIDVVAASRALVAMEPRLVALEAFTDRNRKQARDERTRPTTVVALAKQQLVVLPPLMKGYLRCGARLLGEPHRDDAFGCADFPMMLSLERIDARYQRRFM